MPDDVQLPETLEVETASTPSASVIWLHGLGADGRDFEPIVPELGLPADVAVRFVFPHAPHRPVTINGGYVMRAWYDMLPAPSGFTDNVDHILESEQSLRRLIARETGRGIATDRIVLAGVSQGGAIALHTRLRHPQRLGGILALSTYVPIPNAISSGGLAPVAGLPVFFAHGDRDPLISLPLAEASRELLQEAGVKLEWHVYAMEHTVNLQEIADIGRWLGGLLRA